jgi:hypothetical protein
MPSRKQLKLLSKIKNPEQKKALLAAIESGEEIPEYAWEPIPEDVSRDELIEVALKARAAGEQFRKTQESGSPEIIEIVSLDLEISRKEARRLESIITQEGVEAFVIPSIVAPAILSEMKAARLPVFRINGVTVWEGERPPGKVVREWLHWPKTLEEAVDRVLVSVDEVSEDPFAKAGLAAAIRNSFGLWGANKYLLRSCGSATMSADDASEVILRKALETQMKRESRSD